MTNNEPQEQRQKSVKLPGFLPLVQCTAGVFLCYVGIELFLHYLLAIAQGGGNEDLFNRDPHLVIATSLAGKLLVLYGLELLRRLAADVGIVAPQNLPFFEVALGILCTAMAITWSFVVAQAYLSGLPSDPSANLATLMGLYYGICSAAIIVTGVIRIAFAFSAKGESSDEHNISG